MREWQRDIMVALVCGVAVLVALAIAGVQLANAGDWQQYGSYYRNGDGYDYERYAVTSYRTEYRQQAYTDHCGCVRYSQVAYQVPYTTYDYRKVEKYDKIDYREPDAVDRLLGIAEGRYRDYSKAKTFADAAKLLGLHDVAAELHAAYPPEASYQRAKAGYNVQLGSTQYGVNEYRSLSLGNYSWSGIDADRALDNAWLYAKIGKEAEHEFGTSLKTGTEELIREQGRFALQAKAFDSRVAEVEAKAKGAAALMERLIPLLDAASIKVEEGRQIVPLADAGGNFVATPEDISTILENHCAACHTGDESRKTKTDRFPNGLDLTGNLTSAEWGQVYLAVASKKMPPKKPLSDVEVEALRQHWQGTIK